MVQWRWVEAACAQPTFGHPEVTNGQYKLRVWEPGSAVEHPEVIYQV